MPDYQQTFHYCPAQAHPPQQNPRQYRHFEVEPVSGALGAEVHGIDLTRINDDGFAEFETALIDHLVLFVREQDLEPRHLRAFGERFGTLLSYPTSEPMPGYPEITEFRSRPDTIYNFGGCWHSDSMFMEKPPRYTILHNLESPAVGGDTSFSNLYLAWDALDEELRQSLEDRRAINSSALSFTGVPTDQDPDAAPVRYQDASSEAWQREAVHPVARTHPVTGRKALYVCSLYTAHFVGETQAQSLPLLRELYAHSVRPDFTCRFRWQPGTLAIWDNRCCLHYPHNDYSGQTRAMRRLIVEGERPV